MMNSPTEELPMPPQWMLDELELEVEKYIKQEHKKAVTKKLEPKKEKTLEENIAETKKEIEKEEERIYEMEKAGKRPRQTKLRKLKQKLINIPLREAVIKKLAETYY